MVCVVRKMPPVELIFFFSILIDEAATVGLLKKACWLHCRLVCKAQAWVQLV